MSDVGNPFTAVLLRSYKPDDWEAVREIYDLSKPDEMRGSVDLATIRPLEQDEAHVALFNKASIVVAEGAGQVVGFGGHQDHRIEWVYVHPAHRRKGVASALVRCLLSQMRGTVTLNVAVNNIPARRLYEGLGFRRDREFVGKFNGQDVNVITLKFTESSR
jgi:ribosomal protein S18 acetylase RimI-like enzyme